LAYLLDAIILSFCGGAFPFLVVTNYQGWHDKIARTLVIRV
jgi:hypothetical protein